MTEASLFWCYVTIELRYDDFLVLLRIGRIQDEQSQHILMRCQRAIHDCQGVDCQYSRKFAVTKMANTQLVDRPEPIA